MADDVEALRRYLGLERIDVLGHSSGGMVAMAFALRHGSSVRRMVLSNTAPSFGFWEEAQQMAEELATPEQRKLLPDCSRARP